MPVDHKEKAFESAIEHHLITAAGYTKADQGFFDQVRALDATQFVPFVKDTQPDIWKKLEKLLGSRTEETLLDDLCKAMDSRGSLDVIRHGFKCYGEPVKVAYFAPAHGMNPEVAALYAKNRLTVVRQLLFKLTSTKALDLTICLNGIPIITAELKNPMTGQNVRDAIWQYQYDRDPNDLIFQFKKRTLVHFAVDPDLVFMTTKLAGQEHVLPAVQPGRRHGRRETRQRRRASTRRHTCGSRSGSATACSTSWRGSSTWKRLRTTSRARRSGRRT